jgi:ABC-type transport system substrate-binding protein
MTFFSRAALRACTLFFMTALVAAVGACTPATTTSTSDNTGTVSRANKGIVESGEKPRIGGKIVYGLNAETNGWNPSTNQWAAAGLEVAHTFFDTLTAFDAESKIHPFLVERFDHNPAYTEWTFTLRSGVTFSNGKPLTAEAVVRNQNYLKKSPVTAGAYYYIDSITAKDTNTFVMISRRPWVGLPSMLATQIGVVADPDWLESNDGLEPIGTGPFVLTSWEIGNKLIVEKNPHYWRKDADGTPFPYLDAVEFRVITDENSRAAALQAKDIDIMESFTGPQIQAFQKLDGYQILSDPEGETTESFIQLNTKVAPLDDVDARTALAYATDKQAIIDSMTNGFNEPAEGPFAKSSPYYSPTGYPEYDHGKATELVDKVKARHGSFALTLTGSGDPTAVKLQQLIQAQWQAVGVAVSLETVEQATLIIEVVTGKYQAPSWLQFDGPDPALDGVWWSPELASDPPAFSLNFARLDDAAIGAALAAARAATSPDEARQQYAIVAHRLAVDVPYVWLYHQTVAIIGTQRLVNMTKYTLPDGAAGLDLVQGSHPLHQVWLRD